MGLLKDFRRRKLQGTEQLRPTKRNGLRQGTYIMADVTHTISQRLIRFRIFSLLSLDIAAWSTALILATAVRMELMGADLDIARIGGLILIAAAAHTLAAVMIMQNYALNRVGTREDAEATIATWVIASFPIVVTNVISPTRPVPNFALVLAIPAALLMMFGVRFGWRGLRDRKKARATHLRRTLIFGAGDGGAQIIRAMKQDPDNIYQPVGVIDDLEAKRGRMIHGIKVVGSREDIAEVAEQLSAEVLLMAIPSANSQLVGEVDDLAESVGLELLVLPTTSELINNLRLSDIRELTEQDLLGRAEVKIDVQQVTEVITGKIVLVTGAGGSIGSELCRQLYNLAPQRLIMLDRDETALHAVQLSIEGRALLDNPDLVVADIRDRDRIFEIFERDRPDVVFHTAALKHLSLLENHPDEGVKTNVYGTRNLLDAAEHANVERFVNVSTDKAADPTSVLGRTKLMAERLTAATAARARGTFVSVRFGNVLGSRGSVLPTFRSQIESGGPITVTDPEVTRYFMTIPEAVRLVLQASAIGRPGEIMILDMGEPVKIVDMAHRLIRHSGKRIDIVYTGLRPGEKMHEVLVATDEEGIQREHPRITHTIGQMAGEDSRSDGELLGGTLL
jgi:FlaA1/EpsC-like NDP-sugar epimerase